MAIKLNQKNPINAVIVISKNDDAVDLKASKWDDYKETADVSKLAFLPDAQPTRFLCNFELSSRQMAAVKNGMLSGKDDEGNPQLTLGSWAHRVVKFTLKDIQNPESVPEAERIVYKKDENGLAHDDLIGTLDRYGIVDEIFGFYTKLALSSTKDNAKN